jgi:hypothetical protein
MTTASQKKQNRRSRRKYKRARKLESILTNPARLRVIAEVQRLTRVLGFSMQVYLLSDGLDLWIFRNADNKPLLEYCPTKSIWRRIGTSLHGIEISVVTVLEMVETINGERE